MLSLRRRRLALLVAASGVLAAFAIVIWWTLTPPDETLTDVIETVIEEQDQALVDSDVDAKTGRILTVLIPYDRTRFFIHKGEPRGFEYELVHQFETGFNAERRAGDPPLQSIFVPVPFAQLIDLLAAGKGDIAAGGLTVTPERAERVAFSQSYMRDVRELVVVNRSNPITAVEELAGRRVVVVRGSSYVRHLRALNERFAADGLAAVEIVEAPSAIMSEDLLELVHAGAIEITIVDEHIAQLWLEVLEGIKVTDIAIAEGNSIAWAFAPALDPEMAAAINGFLEEAARGTLLGNILFARYFEDTEWVSNPLGPETIEEVSRYRPLFSRFADEHGLDWKLVAAVAFQESGFDPYARSNAGAVGLMQVLPATAAEMGITDLNAPASQIEAGTRYLAGLVARYREEGIAETEAVNLALAAYNAGPARLGRLREAAAGELALDPDVWFFNVEQAAALDAGLETVRYVANVNKYRLAYELGETILSARAEERERIE